MPNNQKSWFNFEKANPDIEENYDLENLLFSLEFKLSKHVQHHNRSVYTLFDLLGDVGGLFDALKGIMSTTVALYFFLFGNPMHEYLLKALFLNNNV